MIHYLLLYQFPLLYCVTMALGLVVYGSDFDEPAGKLYLIPLLLPVVHWFVGKLVRPVSLPVVSTVILLTGAITALITYRNLHFAYWDEHSLSQSVALAVLGVMSYLASVIASIRLHAWQGNHRIANSSAWLILGLCWLLVFYFPMSSLYVIAAILAVSSVWNITGANDLLLTQYKSIAELRPVKYLIFILAMDLGLVFWDYQVNTSWAWHLGGAFFAGALGCWLGSNVNNRFSRFIIVTAVVNFITAVIWPAFVLHFLHSVLVGLCLGWSMVYLTNYQEKLKPILVVSSAMPVFLGLGFGYLFYANLAFAYWRVLLLLPLLVLMFINYRKNYLAMTESVIDEHEELAGDTIR